MALVKLNNRGVRSVSTFGSISSLGTYTFIKKVTASSSANVLFCLGTIADMAPLKGANRKLLKECLPEIRTTNNLEPDVDTYFNYSNQL